MKELTLIRKNGLPSWIFKWSSQYNAYVYNTNKNTYRLFFDDVSNYKPFWIGKLFANNKTWGTVEKEIKADKIIFCGSMISFI